MLPPIADDSGYMICEDDLDLIGLSVEAVQVMHDRALPLGMTADRFAGFRESLARVLKQENLMDARVYLRGSSVNLFAGTHKTMPYEDHELYDVFRQRHGGRPLPEHLDEVRAALRAQWPPGHRPRRRLFDVLHVLGLVPDRSDYDVEVRSDELVARVHALFEREYPDRPGTAMYVDNPKYGFVDKEYVLEACPALMKWQDAVGRYLRREATVAVFPAEGPPSSLPPPSGLPDFPLLLDRE